AAVVTAAPNFQKDMAAEFGSTALKIRFAVNDAERTDRESVFGEPGFLERFVLNDADRLDSWAQWRDGRHGRERVDSDLLNLQSDGIGACGEAERGVDIVPLANNHFIGDEACGALGLRIHDADAVTHGAGGHGHHAAELAAAENREQAAGRNFSWLGNGRCGNREASSPNFWSSTSCVHAARQAARRS